jgi:thymidylate kinase
LKNKVKIITFSGVDGAGKTTILRIFTELLQQKYQQQVIELRHRPSILPILSSIKHGKKKAELKTMEVLPRTGKNNSKLSSYIRFFYYLIDYIVGQWVIYFKHTKNNHIVIYDRYYFDFINDARRTNIDLDSQFIRFFYRLIFKPQLNIFLYAPPEVILNRKIELDKDSIILLTKAYNTLFLELDIQAGNRYVSIENIDINTTIKNIEEYYIGLLNA